MWVLVAPLQADGRGVRLCVVVVVGERRAGKAEQDRVSVIVVSRLYTGPPTMVVLGGVTSISHV